MHLDPVRLASWLEHRVGYGRLDGTLWLVGMEEACMEAAELPVRMAGAPVEDLREAHARLSPLYDHLFDRRRGRLQPTWRPLMIMALAAEGVDLRSSDYRDRLRQFQAERWGSAAGDVLLAELLPLPSPSTQAWPYQRVPELPELRSREAYESAWKARRASMLRSLWRRHPHGGRVAVAYGKKNWASYKEIFGRSGWRGVTVAGVREWALVREAPDSLVCLVPHPTAWGSKDVNWIELGEFIRGWRTTAAEHLAIPVLE